MWLGYPFFEKCIRPHPFGSDFESKSSKVDDYVKIKKQNQGITQLQRECTLYLNNLKLF
jgi:hypothetical protein